MVTDRSQESGAVSEQYSGPTRRGFLYAAASGFVLAQTGKQQAMGQLDQTIRLGFIADLHHDVMHDGEERLKVFLAAMEKFSPDAIVQMGDFAYPNAKNQGVIDRFKKAHKQALHVLGNHDTDARHTVEQCKSVWGLPAPYYTQEIAGLTLIILDGNEKGSPKFKGGYPSFIGKKQVEWLTQQLADARGPVLVISHQPLAGPLQVDNAVEIQDLLAKYHEKILLAICGHSHIDYMVRIKDIPYWHINSASYYWVGGGKLSHESYSKEIHAKYRSLASTCPYRDALFATLSIDPKSLSITIGGRSSEWVGLSPAEVGADNLTLTDGEEIAARIRDRKVIRRAVMKK